jgi:hypothetical protein
MISFQEDISLKERRVTEKEYKCLTYDPQTNVGEPGNRANILS